LLLATAAAAQAPLTLAEAIRQVRASSDETELIRETRSKLEAQKSEMWAGALPSVSAYGSAGRGAQPFKIGPLVFPSDSTAQNTYRYGIEANQALFSFALGRSVQTAGKVIRAQDAANRRSVQELELATLDAFYGVVVAEARL